MVGNAPINGVSPFAAARQCGAGPRRRLAQRLSLRHGLRPRRRALDAEAERSRSRPAYGSTIPAMGDPTGGSRMGRSRAGSRRRWRSFGTQTEGPQILVGSSMGGYLALLAARALTRPAKPERVEGLILIAPAVDLTEALIWAKAPDEARRAIMDEGVWRRPSAYSSEPDCFTPRPHRGRAQTPAARRHDPHRRANRRCCKACGTKTCRFPMRSKLMQRFGGDPATLTLVKDGDHRLSRPQDLQLMFDALGRMVDPLTATLITPTSRRSDAGSSRGP